jgi:molybdopterin-binding protein
MDRFQATISDIKNVDDLNIVTFDFNGVELKMMSLELQKDIKVGTKVILNTKTTSISFAKDFAGEISISNKLKATIKEYKVGELLCSVKLSIGELIFETIVSVEVFDKLDLQIGDEVTAFIKASDLSISEVCDG